LESVAPPSAATAADQVRGLVEDLLPSGRCSMAEISRTLGVEPRTVHRHLADEGNSFSAILRTTRAGLAERYLANDRYSLTGVSQRLGFASPGAFSSWFRQQ